ncbi:hypothetical protein HanPI659440_Chr00c05g0715361 [Helianthus annuus]|nr:hypothetical protein HanPI659440_Chr00c05g0715361 [Helianthus annuus]
MPLDLSSFYARYTYDAKSRRPNVGLTNSSSYPHHRSDDTLKPKFADNFSTMMYIFRGVWLWNWLCDIE